MFPCSHVPMCTPTAGINWARAQRELVTFSTILATHQEDVGCADSLKLMLSSPDWATCYPNLVHLWMAVAVLPLSIVECERGFSRQNIIKSWLRGNLCDAKLGELMAVSLLNYDMEWPELLRRWNASKKRRPANDVLMASGERQSKRARKRSAAAAAATAALAAAEAAAREVALVAEAARMDVEYPWLTRKERATVPVGSEDGSSDSNEDYGSSESD
ncbi:unnamed protein product [Closterium sp. NIES-54]